MITTLLFGNTGHNSSRIIFGAAALGGMRQERADEVLPVLLEAGVNHIDTAAGYGDSELRLAPWMQSHRDHFFLASKTGERSGAGARAGLECSLERLGVESVDLIQLHNLVEEVDWQEAFGSGGAVQALFAASDEGLCKNVGVTGHGLRIARMHIRSLNEAQFASVLLPYNHALMENEGYAADFAELLDLCVERGVAVQTIKSLARRRWPSSEGRRFSWYEPISDNDVMARSIRFVLANPQVFLNTSSDARLLAPTLEVAAAFDGVPPEPGQLTADRLSHSISPLFDGSELEVI